MEKQNSAVMDVFCAGMVVKEKMKVLYRDALTTCTDSIGLETFKMLRDIEEDHIKHMQSFYEKLTSGSPSPDTCRFFSFDEEEKKTLLRDIAKQGAKIGQACLDSTAAVEMGLKLENDFIRMIDERMKKVEDSKEMELLQRLLSEELKHFKMLADLKYYYEDPQNWLIDQGGRRFDPGLIAS